MTAFFYMGLHGLLMIFLSIRVIRLRRKNRIGVGFGDHPGLTRAARVFGNHNEYAPIFLIFLYAIELNSAPLFLIHGLGITFTVGRISHALALTKSVSKSFGRTLGMSLTFLCLATESIYLLSHMKLH